MLHYLDNENEFMVHFGCPHLSMIVEPQQINTKWDQHSPHHRKLQSIKYVN